MQIFLSYAREDKEGARKLYDSLHQRLPGCSLWFDEKSLIPGEDWEKTIEKKIPESDLFILLTSALLSKKVGVVQEEITLALKRLKQHPPGKKYLIQAKIEECQLERPELEKLHWVDLFPNWEEGIEKILKAVREKEKEIDFGSREKGEKTILYSNVKKANSAEEKDALKERLQDAIKKAQQTQTHKKLESFSEKVRTTSALVNVNLETLDFFLNKDNDHSSPFDLHIPDSEEIPGLFHSENTRKGAKIRLYDDTSGDLYFAALSLEKKGLGSYGEYVLILDEDYMEKRATLLEENFFQFSRKEEIHDELLIKGKFPPGYLCTWSDREKLAVAKLQEQVTATTEESEFPSLLLQTKGKNQEDRYIEVHFYGPFKADLLKSVWGTWNEKGEEKEFIVERIKHRLAELQIERGEV